MEERRKIIIPTGSEEPLPTPHFDAEATMTARPVVPLSEQEAARARYNNYGVVAPKPVWKRPMLIALVVLVAAGIGVAAGFAIGVYRNRQPAAEPVTNVQPAPAESTNQVAVQPTPAPPEPPRVVVPPKNDETASAEDKDEDQDRKDDERERTAQRREPKRNEEEVVTPPPTARDRKRDKKEEADDDEAIFEARQQERERRREERRMERRRARDDEETVDIPRQVERAQRQVNRIRDIFEGRRP